MNDDLTRARVLYAVRELCTSSAFIRTIEHALGEQAKDALPNHRLSQLAGAFAWHADRPQPAARLEAGVVELARLWERAGENPERELYLFLLSKLGLGEELQQISGRVQKQREELEHTAMGESDLRKRRQIERNQRARRRELAGAVNLYNRVLKADTQAAPADAPDTPWFDELGSGLRLPPEVAERWRPELRLRLAIAAVQTLQTLLATAELREAIERRVGAPEGVFTWL